MRFGEPKMPTAEDMAGTKKSDITKAWETITSDPKSEVEQVISDAYVSLLGEDVVKKMAEDPKLAEQLDDLLQEYIKESNALWDEYFPQKFLRKILAKVRYEDVKKDGKFVPLYDQLMHKLEQLKSEFESKVKEIAET